MAQNNPPPPNDGNSYIIATVLFLVVMSLPPLTPPPDPSLPPATTIITSETPRVTRYPNTNLSARNLDTQENISAKLDHMKIALFNIESQIHDLQEELNKTETNLHKKE